MKGIGMGILFAFALIAVALLGLLFVLAYLAMVGALFPLWLFPLVWRRRPRGRGLNGGEQRIFRAGVSQYLH